MQNKINTVMAEEAVQKINDAMKVIKESMDFLIGLEPAQSKSLSRIDAKRYTFVKIAFELAEANDYLRSPFLSFAEGKNDFTLYGQLGLFEASVQELSTKISDTRAMAGHEAYTYARAVYEQSQSATKKGVAGAKSNYEQMKPFFEKTSQKKAEKK